MVNRIQARKNSVVFPKDVFLIGDSVTARGNYGVTVTGIVASDGIATVTTNASHALYPGAQAYIGGASDENYNGLKDCISRASNTEFIFEIAKFTRSPAVGANISCTAQQRFSDRNWFELANSRIGHPFNTVYNFGVSGEKIKEIARRFDSTVLKNSKAGDIVQIQGGYNDFVSPTPADVPVVVEYVKSTFLYMIERALEHNLIPIVCAIVPYDSAAAGYTVLRSQAIRNVNAYLKQICDFVYPEAIFFDMWSLSVDPTNATGNWKTNFSAVDKIHPTANATDKYSQELALILDSFKFKRFMYGRSVSDRYEVDATSVQIDPNPLSQGTTGTKATSGAGSGSITGNMITDYTCTWTRGGAGGSCALSLESRADGFGSDLVIAFVADTLNDAIDIVQTASLHSRIAVGDTIFAEINLKVTGITNISNISFAFEFGSGGVTYTLPAATGSSGSGQMTDDMDMTFRTPDLVVPPAGMTSLKTRIKIVAAGVGGATIKRGCSSIIKKQV